MLKLYCLALLLDISTPIKANDSFYLRLVTNSKDTINVYASDIINIDHDARTLMLTEKKVSALRNANFDKGTLVLFLGAERFNIFIQDVFSSSWNEPSILSMNGKLVISKNGQISINGAIWLMVFQKLHKQFATSSTGPSTLL